MAIRQVRRFLRLRHFRELLAQHKHHLFDRAHRDHVERHVEHLFAYIHVRTGENAKQVNDEGVQDMLVAQTQRIQAVEHDELDIVVALLDRQLNQCTRDGFNGENIISETSQGDGRLVLHSMTRR